MREGGIGIGDPIHYLIEIGDSSTDLDCGLDLASIVRIGRPQFLGSSFKLAIQSQSSKLGATYIDFEFSERKRLQPHC